MSLPSFDRILVLCPDLHEHGGIGAVSRMALTALHEHPSTRGCRGEVWSFWNPPARGEGQDQRDWPHRYASGRKAQYAWWGWRAGLVDSQRTLIVCTHLHLAPVTSRLIARGARMVVLLHGTEAWVPLESRRSDATLLAHELISVSDFTADKFKATNPDFADREIKICPLGAPFLSDNSASPSGIQPPFALIVGRLNSRERYKGHDE